MKLACSAGSSVVASPALRFSKNADGTVDCNIDEHLIVIETIFRLLQQ